MTRLIDADALMEAMKKEYKRVYCPWHFETYKDIVNSITNAPTVEREGWVSVPIEPSQFDNVTVDLSNYTPNGKFTATAKPAAQTDTE